MSYRDTITYLDSFINYEKKSRYPYKDSFKLERIKGFLESIGNPHSSTRFLHVAGTKGKGSVCVLTAYILRGMGYKVGLYTSPHLTDVRERLRVLEPGAVSRIKDDFEGMIQQADLARLTDDLRPKISSYAKNSPYGQLSFFEVYTALAFLYFKEQAVDYTVLETGLGGRLDATNVVSPEVSAITPISFDHTNKLGNTLAEIAAEKAGIIKPSGSRHAVISAPQPGPAAEVIRRRCRELGAVLYEVGKDIFYKPVSSSLSGQTFDLSGAFGSFKGLKLPLIGEHQLMNASVAIGLAAQSQAQAHKRLNESGLKNGLAASRWPGRCEIMQKDPLIVLDGAHNEASAQVLAKTLADLKAGGKIILVLGVSRDKDIKGICGTLAPLCQECIITMADNPRALEASKIAQVLKDYSPNIRVSQTRTVPAALKDALGGACRNDLIVVTGSLFIVGEAREFLKKKEASAG